MPSSCEGRRNFKEHTRKLVIKDHFRKKIWYARNQGELSGWQATAGYRLSSEAQALLWSRLLPRVATGVPHGMPQMAKEARDSPSAGGATSVGAISGGEGGGKGGGG